MSKTSGLHIGVDSGELAFTVIADGKPSGQTALLPPVAALRLVKIVLRIVIVVVVRRLVGRT